MKYLKQKKKLILKFIEKYGQRKQIINRIIWY